jgi:hypothetical protein
MAFPGYDALRKRHPDTGFILIDKRKTAEEFPDYVKTNEKLGDKDIYVHKDDSGKIF